MSRFINVEINTDVDVYVGDVLNQIDDDELRDEVIRRELSARINLGTSPCRELQTRRIPPHPVRHAFTGLSSVR